MIIYGAGGISLVLLDVLEDMDVPVSHIIDDNPQISSMNEIPVFHPELIFDSNNRHQPQVNRSDNELMIAIGNCDQRKALVDQYPGPWGKAIHGSVLVSGSATVGVGTMIFHGSAIQAKTNIGDHVIINTRASIDHDCSVGNFVHIAPNVTLCGYVTIADGADIGAATTVIPGVTIGEGAIVGAGAVVLKDVPPMSVAVGVPARVVKYR